jgi:hypothetical protein
VTISTYKRIIIVLSVVCVALLTVNGMFLWNHGRRTIELAFADEQTRIFDEMRVKATQSGPADAVGYMQYAITYYPSGTKQRAGSQLDRIVERERGCAVREIICHLRATTKEDLGENPSPWIKKYLNK